MGITSLYVLPWRIGSDAAAPQYLTRFYLMISFGGALGGIMVGLVAPRILPAYYELGIGFIIIALSALFLLHKRQLLTAGAACLALLCGYFLFAQVSDDFKDTRRWRRGSRNPADFR